MPLIDSRLTNEAATEFLTTEDELDYLIQDEAGTITEGAWDQSATWAATAAETFASTATFAQDATWDATAAQTLTATATWLQEATWDATAATAAGDVPIVGHAVRGAWQMTLVPVPKQRISAVATFIQSDQPWTARVRQTDDELIIALA